MLQYSYKEAKLNVLTLFTQLNVSTWINGQTMKHLMHMYTKNGQFETMSLAHFYLIFDIFTVDIFTCSFHTMLFTIFITNAGMSCLLFYQHRIHFFTWIILYLAVLPKSDLWSAMVITCTLCI